jgi:hypothetical protein
MGWQAIETEPRNECAVVPVGQDADNTTAFRGTARHGNLSQRQSASTAVSLIRRLAGSTAAAEERWTSGRPLARASATAGACILWLAMAASGDKALCGEDSSRRQAAGRAKVDIFAGQSFPTQRSDAAQNKVAQALQPALAAEKKQSPQNEQEKNKAEVLGCALNSSLREELEALRSAAEAAAIEQGKALDQERDRVDALSRELNTARIDSYLEGAQTLDAELKQRQALEREQAKADRLARDLAAIQGELAAARTEGPKAAQATTAEVEQKQAFEQQFKQERDRAEGLASELTLLRAELKTSRAEYSESVRIAQAAKLEQGLELEKSRSSNEKLARELASARKEAEERSALLAAAHANALQVAETNRAIAAEQKQALAGERDRANTVTRELTSFKREVEAHNQQVSVLNALSGLHPREPAGGLKAEQAVTAEAEQKQALERQLKQERERTEGLAGELTSLRTELETLRAKDSESVRIAQAAKIEQGLELEKLRSNNETLVRELAAARKEAEERSARLAAAHANALRVEEANRAIAAKQKQAVASERDRADTVTRELASFKRELEARDLQISVLNALSILHPREPAGHSSDAGMAASPPRTIAANGRSLGQVPGDVVVATAGQPFASEPPRSQAQSPVGEATSELDPKPSMVAEQVTSGRAAPRPPLDEQRLLLRANALLRRADISGARPLLEHALERGSARAAFMLAETYDTRVLQTWRVHGISGDSAKARAFYQLAQAGGIEDAKKRIETLK